MGFFDNWNKESGEGNPALRPCPECGADKVERTSSAFTLGSTTYECKNCRYKPDEEEVFRGFFETLRAGTGNSDNFTISEGRKMASQMDQNVNPKELISPMNFKLEPPLAYLDDDESMKYLFKGIDVDIDGDDAGHWSYTIITDKRVIIATAGFLGKATRHSISYQNITDVSLGGRITSVLEIRTAGHTYEITGFSGKVAKACFSYIREMVETDGTKPDSTDTEDEAPLDKLEHLAELNERGILSQEEFETKKQELLDDV